MKIMSDQFLVDKRSGMWKKGVFGTVAEAELRFESCKQKQKMRYFGLANALLNMIYECFG